MERTEDRLTLSPYNTRSMPHNCSLCSHRNPYSSISPYKCRSTYARQWPQHGTTAECPVQAIPGDNGNREYRSQPQPAEMYSFDKDDECDRELLREDPYAEYLDFPEEYRMKDEAQMEMICC